jgi:penicillin-binding protein 1B
VNHEHGAHERASLEHGAHERASVENGAHERASLAKGASRAFSIGRFVASLAFVLVPPTLSLGALDTWMEYEQIEQKLLAKFEGERWDAPARIYSDSYTVYPSLRVDTQSFRRRLERLGYRSTGGTPSRRGSYTFSRGDRRFEIFLNEFDYPNRREPGRLVKMTLDEAGRIVSMREGDREVTSFELEPALLSSAGRGEYEQRSVRRLDEFPPLLVRAVLATEDRRFFDHAGVDVFGLSRALAVNMSEGEARRGGSTITQQLMTNFVASEQRTPGRSVREAALALVAESRFSKDEILGNYLNEIYMGQNGSAAVHGMGEAARFYFDRDVAALTLGEMATLAGIVRSPGYYSPHQHPERAQSRRDLVLSQLYDQGAIDDAAYELALNEPMEVARVDTGELQAPYFVDFVSRELTRRFPARVLQSEGFRIFTTLDPEMQAIAESVVADNVVEMERDIGEALAAAGQPLQAAMVVMEPQTGAIRAMVGGRDYGGSRFNRAIDMRRMPGSTFKPIVALAAVGSEQVGARHFKPTSQIMDERMQWEWQGSVWSPRNYEGEFYGMVTIREAIEHSLNSAVARMSKDIGVKPIRDLAVRMGMSADLGVYPSIVLGGHPVPLLDMAKVFNVFATGGMRVTPMSVATVVGTDGENLGGGGVESRRIVPATDAYLVTHMLEGVMERGTGATARRKGFKHPAAGKTGTSNDYKDAWFVGFTPNLLTAVWIGFDEPASMGLAGSEAALPIWTDFMRQALADTPHDSFEVPRGVVIADVDKKNGLIAQPECPKQVREAFLAGEEPRHSCRDHGGQWR